MELDHAIQSLCPIRVDTGQGTFTVPQPTVRQALLLHGTLMYWEEESYADRIRDVIEEWLPESIIRELEDLEWEFQVNIFLQILSSCEPDVPDGKTDAKARKDDLGMMLADYRVWYKADVLEEPWGFFLYQAKCLTKAKAQWELTNATWYISAKDEGSFKNLLKRSGFDDVVHEDISEHEEYLDVAQELERAGALIELY